MKSGHYTIRVFSLKDVQLYKNIRLEALQSEPSFFGSNYAREAAFTEEEWLSRINNNSSACFGLFYNEELIGLTGIYIDPDNAALGQLAQSYIRKEFRGKGLSALLYDARIAWARDRGLNSLQVGHRENNIASKRANQHHGFKYTHREAVNWPGGSTGDILYYLLEL